MPFKSEAQRKKFIQLEREGKLAKGTTSRWESETPSDKPLPIKTGKPKTLREMREIAKKKLR